MTCGNYFTLPQVQHLPEPPKVHFLCPSRPSAWVHYIPQRDNGRSPQILGYPWSSFPKNLAPTTEPPRQGQLPSPLCTRVCNKIPQIHSPALHKNPFVWDQQAQESFDALKQALAFAPLLSAPNFTWDFILYVSSTDNVITGVLVQEDDAHHEHVIYYINQKLAGPLLWYSPEEKLALAIVFSA